MFEQMMNYSYKRHIQAESQEHPVMMSEAAVRIQAFLLVYHHSL